MSSYEQNDSPRSGLTSTSSFMQRIDGIVQQLFHGLQTACFWIWKSIQRKIVRDVLKWMIVSHYWWSDLRVLCSWSKRTLDNWEHSCRNTFVVMGTSSFLKIDSWYGHTSTKREKKKTAVHKPITKENPVLLHVDLVFQRSGALIFVRDVGHQIRKMRLTVRPVVVVFFSLFFSRYWCIPPHSCHDPDVGGTLTMQKEFLHACDHLPYHPSSLISKHSLMYSRRYSISKQTEKVCLVWFTWTQWRCWYWQFACLFPSIVLFCSVHGTWYYH